MERRTYNKEEMEANKMERRMRNMKDKIRQLKEENRALYIVVIVMTIIIVALTIRNGVITRKLSKQDFNIWQVNQQLSDEQFQHLIDNFDNEMLIRCLMDVATEAANTTFTTEELEQINSSYERFLDNPNERVNVTQHYGCLSYYTHVHGVDFPYAEQ